MGSRAVVIFHDRNKEGKEGVDALYEPAISPAIYCHHYGEPAGIYACLAELVRRRVRGDVDMLAARMTQVIGDLLDSSRITALSLRIFGGPATITRKSMARYADMADDFGVYVVSPTDHGTLVVRRFRRNPGGNVVEMDRDEVGSEHVNATADPLYSDVLRRLEEKCPTWYLGAPG